jgi:hypothetical protein
MSKFKGRLMGVEYDNPTLFEQSARALGFRRCKGRSTHSKRTWRPGTPVAVLIDGERIQGQVWSESDRRGSVWVALDNGRYVSVFTQMRNPIVSDIPGGTQLGRVA